MKKKLKTISFAEAIVKITEDLKVKGSGVLTEIDILATMKKKLDKDYLPLIIYLAAAKM